MIKLDSDDVDFLTMVINKGNTQQSAAAKTRLQDLMRLDAMTGGGEHVYLDSKDSGSDPVEKARQEMIERNRNAWKTGTRLDVTYVQPNEAEQPRNFRMPEGDVEDEAEKARKEMIKRHQNAWKKDPWQPGQD